MTTLEAPPGGAGAGGAAAGGTSAGGSAAGGSAAGGAASGGAGGDASGGGPTTQSECLEHADCALLNSCCDCAGVPVGTDIPCDDTECFAPACAAFEPVTTQCRLGRCVTSVDCDISKVLCFATPPSCPPGQTPTHDGAGCWGGCFPSKECASVALCDQCGPGEACVAEVAQLGPVFHCVPIEEECGDTPDCACMGDTVCTGPFDQCVDAAGYLACECSTC